MFSYALSLLTGRMLLVNITEPCSLQNFLLLNKVNWLRNVENFTNLTKHYIPIDHWWRGEIQSSKLSQINFLVYKNDTDVLVVSTGLSIIRHLTVNPAHHNKIVNQLGYPLDKFNIENLIHRWFYELFKLTEKVETKFKRKLYYLKPYQSDELICAQIRIGGDYGIQFMKENETKLFWNFIRNNLTLNHNKELEKNRVPIRLFVTSDSAKVIDDANKQMPDDQFEVIGFPKNSFHINFATQNKKKCQDIENLIVEWLLLGNCTMGVISHSGFGFIGILNRDLSKLNMSQFYVFTNPQRLKEKFWRRELHQRDFYQFSYSFLYLEFNNN